MRYFVGLLAMLLSGCFDLSSLASDFHGDLSSPRGDGLVLGVIRGDGDAGESFGDMTAALDAVAPPPDLATSPDLDPPLDLASPPDLVPPCAGWRGGPNNACWYAGQRGQDCDTICMPHGGFDIAGSTHTGSEVTLHFYPFLVGAAMYPGGFPVELAVLKIDGNGYVDSRWSANGATPKGSGPESGPNARSMCACLN